MATADPADIQAAARGVVRVVIIGSDGQEVYPLSHGTGFAITPRQIATNAHVVREAAQDDSLRIGIVPSDGDDASYAKILRIAPSKDLALLEITGDLRLPPLTIAGIRESDGAEVTSVGYPMNVDRAQGLEIDDIFQPQPTVNSRGFISGQRPSRQFDTILHTAPIARGNSGGPLLDRCGRVLGVNSFGADGEGADAEFYFAVSNRELLPFLRASNVAPRTNAQPCRTLADLDEAEQDRVEREQLQARQELAARSAAERDRRDRIQLEAEQDVQASRENQMALALIALLIGSAAGFAAFQAWGRQDGERQRMIAGTIAAVGLVAALALWFTRPGLDAIDRKIAAAMSNGSGAGGPAAGAGPAPGDAALVCTLLPERSRITGDPAESVEFDWAEDGCVNGRTQYGFQSGEWSRVFVPNEEAAVAINRYDPDTRTYRTDRYLLSATAMRAAREARGAYTPPKCEVDGAAGKLGDLQSAVTSQLPERPNERLVYRCDVKG
ncbi:serine protease [Parerythrobacter jejuensis]|uniref:S1 family peptidase n=1 Tax=Parerythrobacter jejuensis TaxID=795812 RepID=UPI0031DA8FF8